MEEVTVNEELLGQVINNLVKSFDDELFNLKENELESRWFWNWNDEHSVNYNTYEFFDLLGLYQRSCRRWEEKHNGYICVVGRVRDKYLIPKIEGFLKILKEKQ
jgi:hypothetical protein